MHHTHLVATIAVTLPKVEDEVEFNPDIPELHLEKGPKLLTQREEGTKKTSAQSELHQETRTKGRGPGIEQGEHARSRCD